MSEGAGCLGERDGYLGERDSWGSGTASQGQAPCRSPEHHKRVRVPCAAASLPEQEGL